MGGSKIWTFSEKVYFTFTGEDIGGYVALTNDTMLSRLGRFQASPVPCEWISDHQFQAIYVQVWSYDCQQ